MSGNGNNFDYSSLRRQNSQDSVLINKEDQYSIMAQQGQVDQENNFSLAGSTYGYQSPEEQFKGSDAYQRARVAANYFPAAKRAFFLSRIIDGEIVKVDDQDLYKGDITTDSKNRITNAKKTFAQTKQAVQNLKGRIEELKGAESAMDKGRAAAKVAGSGYLTTIAAVDDCVLALMRRLQSIPFVGLLAGALTPVIRALMAIVTPIVVTGVAIAGAATAAALAVVLGIPAAVLYGLYKYVVKPVGKKLEMPALKAWNWTVGKHPKIKKAAITLAKVAAETLYVIGAIGAAIGAVVIANALTAGTVGLVAGAAFGVVILVGAYENFGRFHDKLWGTDVSIHTKFKKLSDVLTYQASIQGKEVQELYKEAKEYRGISKQLYKMIEGLNASSAEVHSARDTRKTTDGTDHEGDRAYHDALVNHKQLLETTINHVKEIDTSKVEEGALNTYFELLAHLEVKVPNVMNQIDTAKIENVNHDHQAKACLKDLLDKHRTNVDEGRDRLIAKAEAAAKQKEE